MNEPTDPADDRGRPPTEEAVPGADRGEPAAPRDGVGDRGLDPLTRRMIAGALVIVLIALLGVVIQPPKVILSPGDGEPVGPAIEISGTPTYQSAGQVLFLTVLLTRGRPTLFELAAASLDSHAEIVDEKEIYGNQSRKASDQLDRALMRESQSAAKRAALGRLGYTVTETGKGAVVRGVVPDSPASQQLLRGDVITAADGAPVTTNAELGVRVRTRAPGLPVTLTVERNKAIETLTLVTTANARGEASIGVYALTADPVYTYPFEITIDPGNVSGPSAGLAFSLGIIDELTPGELTGGKKVAATGTITPEGAVGPIGGIAQKAVAARAAGARLMLVPKSEVDEARSAKVDITIVGVETLDDALAALVAAGGAPVPGP